MKVAVLGGGITGLTASYYLARDGHKVSLFEKNDVLGGLAVGFKEPHWKWPLERAYHHLFASDNDILDFAKEIGFDKIFFSEPHTDSLYVDKGNYRIIPVDSPKDFLTFPLLPLVDRIRASFVLAILKFLPFFPYYEHITAEKFTKKYMGEKMWNVFFQELFREKFGKYAGKVLASFLWARINKRTKKLGYMRGGFQSFVDQLEKVCKEVGVEIRVSYEIAALKKVGSKFVINDQKFDYVISTLPSPVLAKVGGKVLPSSYLQRLLDLDYLHALVLIVETDKPLLDSTYWLNICTSKIPMMLIAQHTNLVDKKYYGNNHIAYIGYYLERDDPRMNMSEKELYTSLLPHIKEIQPRDFKVIKLHRFVGPFAQPIFNKKFVKNKPDFITPAQNFFVANLDMTYPYDRGTNYAVSLGREVAKVVAEENSGIAR